VRENEELALEVEELNTAIERWRQENGELRAERDEARDLARTLFNSLSEYDWEISVGTDRDLLPDWLTDCPAGDVSEGSAS
jgi:hypothetical protein